MNCWLGRRCHRCCRGGCGRRRPHERWFWHRGRNDRRSAVLLVFRFLGLGGVVDALFRGTVVAEDQQQVAAAVQGGSRYGADDRKWLAGIVDHFLDRRDRVTRRETLTQAGADQQVAFLDVGSVCHMPQFKALRVACAAGNRTQAITVDLYGNAVGCVREQQYP